MSAWSGGIKRTEADKWFSLCIRLAADHICEYCQTREAKECAHIYGRANHATRYAKDNALALCHHCHKKLTENPLDVWDFLDQRHPGRRDRLMVKRRGTLKNTAANRKLISAHYREEHHRMEATGSRDLESWN